MFKCELKSFKIILGVHCLKDVPYFIPAVHGVVWWRRSERLSAEPDVDHALRQAALTALMNRF